MAWLIDSSVFIDLERRGDVIGSLDAVAAGEPIALSSITATELLHGIERTDSIVRRQRRAAFVESVLADLPVLSFDLQAARVHARVWAQIVATGHSVAPHDLIIAATALTQGYGVLTHNVRHFERVPGLVVQEPSW